MPDNEEARGTRKALKFVGNVKAGKYVPGIPAQDLTQDQAETWIPDDALYAEALSSGWYEEANKTEAKAIEAEATADAEPAPPKRGHKE